MKTRILTAACLVPVFLGIVYAAPKICTVILFSVVCAIAAYELLHSTGFVKEGRMIAWSVLFAAAVPFWCRFGMPYIWALLAVLAFSCLLFAELLISHAQVKVNNLCLCYVAAFVIPFMLSALVRIHMQEKGLYLIMVPLIMAFISDSGAYFVGRAFGKHKLAPVISPNKTVEGVMGAVITAVVFMVIYFVVLQYGFFVEVNYLYAVIYGIVGSLAGVFGDLSFSAIKRSTGIKDYGNLMPGHGGVLDRFDSMVVIAPLAEVLMTLLPVVV